MVVVPLLRLLVIEVSVVSVISEVVAVALDVLVLDDVTGVVLSVP